MDDLFKTVVDTPIPKLLIIAGFIFLGVGLVGKIGAKINPGTNGRIACVAFGSLFLIAGLVVYLEAPRTSGTTDITPGASSNSPPGSMAGLPSPLPPSSVPVAGGPPASGFRVIEAWLRADPFDYTGPCPVTIHFTGRISVVGSGTVTYRFGRSDGASARVQTLTFANSGSKNVSTTWALGKSYSGWESIMILDPQTTSSRHANFKIQCQ
ncbi:MAG: hypothetical protein KGJ88_11615 [Verrucomicrobiota bacterium]|nr:hypothetical protein [Verrucomicrobiota bacterium]